MNRLPRTLCRAFRRSNTGNIDWTEDWNLTLDETPSLDALKLQIPPVQPKPQQLHPLQQQVMQQWGGVTSEAEEVKKTKKKAKRSPRVIHIHHYVHYMNQPPQGASHLAEHVPGVPHPPHMHTTAAERAPVPPSTSAPSATATRHATPFASKAPQVGSELISDINDFVAHLSKARDSVYTAEFESLAVGLDVAYQRMVDTAHNLELSDEEERAVKKLKREWREYLADVSLA